MSHPAPALRSLFVHAIMADGRKVTVGLLRLRNSRNLTRPRYIFCYEPTFVEDPAAYALDPVHLSLWPLADRLAPAGGNDVHPVLEDSLPDGWGRPLLARWAQLDPAEARNPMCLLQAVGCHALGRLLFSPTAIPPSQKDPSLPFAQLATAIREARLYEASPSISPDRLPHLLTGGCWAGGARPKLLVERGGERYIAKFASMRDYALGLSVALEQAGMILARRAGLHVPDCEVVRVEGEQVFLIKRFDLTSAGGRNAMISFRTLLGTEDPETVRYARLARVLLRFSHQPQTDMELIFRQMVTNVLLRNTDDHLKNFTLLHTAAGYELSPTYDLVPNLYQRHQLMAINPRRTRSGRSGEPLAIRRGDLLVEGRAFGLEPGRAEELLDEVRERLSGWLEVFDACGIDETHTGELRKAISRRFAAAQG